MSIFSNGIHEISYFMNDNCERYHSQIPIKLGYCERQQLYHKPMAYLLQGLRTTILKGPCVNISLQYYLNLRSMKIYAKVTEFTNFVVKAIFKHTQIFRFISDASFRVAEW